MVLSAGHVAVSILVGCVVAATSGAEYYGLDIGEIRTLAHGVRGRVYVVDDETLFIKGFEYDGQGPDAFFWVGTGGRPSPQGRPVPYPAGSNPRSPPILRAARGEDILLKLAPGDKVTDIDYLSVWCRAFTADFGHVLIPKNIQIPRQQTIEGFATRRNGVRSSSVIIEDDKTLLVQSFSYDGRARDAYFVAGTGNNPSLLGNFIQLADERGGFNPLREYRSENIKLELPRNRSLTEFNWISVYSRSEDEDLGHITLPRQLNVPPSMKLMQVPVSGGPASGSDDNVFTNCIEPFRGQMQVRWKLSQDRRNVVIQLMGKIQNARGTNSEYMAFGLSGTPGRASMIGGDVVVAYYDQVKDMFAVDDYYLGAKSQCDGSRGVCKDDRLGGSDDAQFTRGELIDDVSVVTYQRPVEAGDSRLDARIPLEDDVTVIAAIGQLSTDNMARYHSKRTDANLLIGFGRENQNSCGAPLVEDPSLHERGRPVGGTGAGYDVGPGSYPHDNRPGQHPPHDHDQRRTSSLPPWNPNVIHGVTQFEAKIGPTGGPRGYSSITGHPSWGIAWWINGQLIPEIYVERGKTYRFTIEGGDSENPAESHPFYITDSFEGGFGQKQSWERDRERIFAGVRTGPGGIAEPTGRGRLCKYMNAPNDQRQPENFQTMQEWQSSLKVVCSPGNPGEITWTVDPATPDEVYYQCFTHKNMGWKIHVRNPGFVYSGAVLNSSLSSAVLLTSLLALIFRAIF